MEKNNDYQLKKLSIFLFIYFIINLLFLTKFPFMHSDESWLSGLSRNMLETGSFSVTEPFFDLKIRNPHAIKILYHMIQILFIRVMGYSLLTVRFISIIFGMLTLLYFYKLSLSIFQSKRLAFFSVILLAIDIQFLYASHLARQEIILVFVLVLGLYLFFSTLDHRKLKHDAFIGIAVGLSIGIHPNSFIIALPFVTIYLFFILLKVIKPVSLIVFTTTVAFFTTGFVLLSFSFDPNFIANYLAYGQSEFGVLEPLHSKFAEIKDFYLKLYHGVSGTYYMPNIKIHFIIFSVVLIYTLTQVLTLNLHSCSKPIGLLLSFISVNAGIVFIGRYNQTSIIFIFPVLYLLLANLISKYSNKQQFYIITILFFSLMMNSFANIYPYLGTSYKNYHQQISKVITPESIVLGNLNTEYFFDNGKLLDFRNLAFLRENGLTFEDYIRKNKIEYIIYSEEMDYIFDTRPKWYGLYGNLTYYEDMQSFLKDHCIMVHHFTDKTYGVRISRLINSKEWAVTIYKVLLHSTKKNPAL